MVVGENVSRRELEIGIGPHVDHDVQDADFIESTTFTEVLRPIQWLGT